MTISDGELVASTLAGDDLAFGRLYDRYAGVVRGIAFEATGNIVDSQDLAQEVFLRAFRKLPTLRDPDRFGPWVVTIVRRTASQWRRARGRDRHAFVGDAASDVEELHSRPIFSDLRAAILELTDDERVAIHLFYFEEQPANQAHSILGVSLSGFYRVLDRAREKIREKLADNHEVKP